MRSIICSNTAGEELQFASDLSGWLITDVEGIYRVNANNYTADNAMVDGATWFGASLPLRNIVITAAELTADHQAAREKLYAFFRPRTLGTLLYSEDGESRQIDYYVESVEITTSGRLRQATLSLICPNPLFYAEQDEVHILAGWLPGFTFEHTFQSPNEPNMFGSRQSDEIAIADTASDNIGVTIRAKSWRDVDNLTITHTSPSGEIKSLKLQQRLKRLQTLVITTGVNNKHVYLDGKEDNTIITTDSEFFTLSKGVNRIVCKATSGTDDIDVTLSFRPTFMGV